MLIHKPCTLRSCSSKWIIYIFLTVERKRGSQSIEQKGLKTEWGKREEQLCNVGVGEHSEARARRHHRRCWKRLISISESLKDEKQQKQKMKALLPFPASSHQLISSFEGGCVWGYSGAFWSPPRQLSQTVRRVSASEEKVTFEGNTSPQCRVFLVTWRAV